MVMHAKHSGRLAWLLVFCGAIDTCSEQTAVAGDELSKEQDRDQTSLQSAAEMVLIVVATDGIKMPSALTDYFSLPANIRMKEVSKKNEAGLPRAIFVRRATNSPRFDIILTIRINKAQAYFFHTSASGKLIKGVMADGRLNPVGNKEVQKAFQDEVSFWRKWNLETRADREKKRVNQ
jgi:hypothetical protein